MPPKIDLSLLIAKRDNSANSLNELFEEFQVLYNVQAEISTVENVYKQIEKKFRLLKQQQEIIMDRILENKSSNPEETETILENNKKIGVSLNIKRSVRWVKLNISLMISKL